jgi:hypothetical protein
LLDYYKKIGVVQINENNFKSQIFSAFKNHDKHKNELLKAIETNLSFDVNNKKNVDLWQRAIMG